jgi:hypothetical protein
MSVGVLESRGVGIWWVIFKYVGFVLLAGSFFSLSIINK